jgi:hypothetical protein
MELRYSEFNLVGRYEVLHYINEPSSPIRSWSFNDFLTIE